jgi:hypothetical protein
MGRFRLEPASQATEQIHSTASRVSFKKDLSL